MSDKSSNAIICLIVSAPLAALTGYFFHKYNKNSKLHEKLVDAPNFTPSALLQELKDGESNVHRRFNTEDVKHHQKRGLFFIDGLGQSPSPLAGKLDETMRLLASVYLKTDIYSNEHLSERKENDIVDSSHLPQGHTLRIAPILEIKDYESNETVRVRLADKPNVSFLDELVKKEEMFKLNIIEKILVFFAMLFKFFSDKTIRGLRIGIREKELGIKVDTLLSAYGTVVYDTQSHKISLEGAEFIARDKASLVKLVGDEKSLNRLLFIFFFAATFGFGYLGVRSLMNEKKKGNASQAEKK